MSFPTLTYKPGSYALIEGKKDADTFYIIIKGKMRTHKASPVIGEEDIKILGPGDFFGVESAMARQSRIETVIAMSDATLIEISAEKFGMLIQKSAPIAMKIIRSFSVKLREFDNNIARLSFKNVGEEDISHIFELAEYWFNQNRMIHATYAYQRYLQIAPNGEFTEQAKMRLQGLKKPFQAPPSLSDTLSRNYIADQLIFCENELGYELYIIRTGGVKITKMLDGQEVMLAMLQPGDIFGEMAILDNKPRTATAITSGNSNILAINKANFETMVKTQPQLASKIITLLSERIWTAYRQLANLLIGDITGRIYDTLLIIAEKNHMPITFKSKFTFEFGTKDLLKMLGLNPNKDEHYLVEIFNNNRWLRLEQGRIVCYDLSELKKQVDVYRKKVIMEKKRQQNVNG